MTFEDRVLKSVSQYTDEEDFDHKEAVNEIAGELTEVADLSKTLSKLLFVGKAKGEALEALGKLFILGMQYAFSVGISTNITFLRALCPYIRFFEKSQLRTVSEYFENHIRDLSIDLEDDSAVEERVDLSDVLQSMRDFRHMLGGEKLTTSRPRRAQHRDSTDLSVMSQVPRLRGVKSLEELENEATQDSVRFESVEKKTILTRRKPSSSQSQSQIDHKGESYFQSTIGVTKANPTGRSRSSSQASFGLYQEEVGDSDEYASEEKEKEEEEEEEDGAPRGKKATKDKKSGTVAKRFLGKSSAQRDDKETLSKRPRRHANAPHDNRKDDSDSDSDDGNNISSWGRGGSARRSRLR